MMQLSTPVGFIISWRVPSTVTLADLRNGIAAAGHDPIDLAPDLKPASLVARTAGMIAKRFTTKDVKHLARKIDYTKRQITREDRDPTGLTYSAEEHIQFDDAKGKVTNSMGVALVEQHEIETTRRAGDVMRAVQRIVDLNGSDLIEVRDQGGAYFVPAGHSVIDKVRAVIEGVGGSLRQFACTIGHGAESDRTGQSVAQVITDYLLKQIAELQEAVDELADKKKVRSDVKSARLTRVATLKDRIANYAGLISTQSDALTAALSKAEATLLARLGQDDEEEAQPVDDKDASFAATVGGEREWNEIAALDPERDAQDI